MVRLNTLLESFVLACQRADELPSDVTYATVELDNTGRHSNVQLPIIEFTVESIDRVASRNTETVGYIHDDAGNEIGYKFAQWFDAEITARVITAAATQYNYRDLDWSLRRTLVRYDNYTPHSESLPDPDTPSEDLSNVTLVELDSTRPDHDFTLSPTIRRREHVISVKFEHVFESTNITGEEDYLDSIDLETAVSGSD